MNLEDKRVIKTKREIRTALLKILETKPLSQITVKEIAEAACINRKTFYTHYTAPEDILAELEDELVQSIAYYVENVLVGEYNLGPQYFLQFINTIYASNPQFCENLVSVRNYSFLSDKLKKVLKDQILLHLQIPPERGYEASAVLEYFIGGAAAVYVNWIREDKPVPFEAVTSMISGLMVSGIRAISQLFPA